MHSMTENQKRYLSDFSLLLVAVTWGGGFVAVKDALSAMPPMTLLSLRFVLAAGVHYLFLHRKIGKINRSDLKKGAVLGVLLYLAFSAQTIGLIYTTASKQGFLTATYVVMVPLILWVYSKRRPMKKDLIGGVVTLVGIGLIGISEHLTLNIGDALTLLCAFFFAVHILATAVFSREMDVFKLSFLQIFFAAILFTVSAWLFEPMPSVIALSDWGAVFYLAVFSTFLCFTIQTAAQKHTAASHASILLSLESVFAALFGIVLLHEQMTFRIAIGCLLIFSAVWIVELNLKKRA